MERPKVTLNNKVIIKDSQVRVTYSKTGTLEPDFEQLTAVLLIIISLNLLMLLICLLIKRITQISKRGYDVKGRNTLKQGGAERTKKTRHPCCSHCQRQH